jgi:hypothetical protein
MEKVTVTKQGEPYNQPGFDLPLAFKKFEPDFEGSRVRLGGRDVQQLAMSLHGFRDKRFDMRWGERVFLGCRVVEEQVTSAVVEYASTDEALEEE